MGRKWQEKKEMEEKHEKRKKKRGVDGLGKAGETLDRSPGRSLEFVCV